MGQTIAMTDGELLEASRRGERDAFGALVERYQHVVCAITYSRTRDQALSEDVAQDTFIAAWRQLDQLREPGRLKSWLVGIARNLARKARRRSDRETPIEEPIVEAGGSPFDAVSDAQAERVVGEALSRVPETYRDVLVLYYREQRSVREVAAALGISEAATLQRLARGRQHLADGVTSLVERSLRGQRKPRRDLVAAVVLALPPLLVPSHVEASIANSARPATKASPGPLGSPVSYGGSMLKLAIAAVAISATGTTAYFVHDSRGGASASASAAPGAAPLAEVAPTPARAAAPAPAVGSVFAPRAASSAPAPTPDTPCEKDKCEERSAAADQADQAVSAEIIERLGLERGPTRGAAEAPVTITMFTDMKCKYCGGAIGLLDQLLDEYEGKVRIVVKQMPLKEATKVMAEALYAAEAQGKFWQLYDLMHANQADLTPDSMFALAQQAGVDVVQLRKDLDRGTYRPTLEADQAAAAELAIQGTPAFVINGQRINGLQPPAEFRALIDRQLAARK